MDDLKKTSLFKNLLTSPDLAFICEAHNGLSARIVEEAGFKGIWASGLSISAQLGVRDNNEASWTQVLDVVEFMADASRIPIMLDGDTGYGNFNNFQRLVKKLEQRGAAAVCIEDKLFPKTNSFIAGKQQPLADMHEFSGKIKAGKDAQSDADFSIVARVEAFIAGWGVDEALRRAEAYHAAGADAILIHSALTVPDEILSFAQAWQNRCPVVIVPTKYYATPTDVFRSHGISMVIWANQILRSSITAMRDAARDIFEAESLTRVEQRVVSVSEVFRLQGAEDLEVAESRYLPSDRKRPSALVLAASRGEELGELTLSRPKTMVRIGNRPLLAHIIQSYQAVGIKDISVVRGYAKQSVNLPGVDYVDNDLYAETGELYSLSLGLQSRAWGPEGVMISYGDVLFRKYIPQLLLDAGCELAVVVDTQWQESVNKNRDVDYVHCSLPYSRQHYNRAVSLEEVSGDLPANKVHGEWMGFLLVTGKALAVVQEELALILAAPAMRKAKMPLLLNRLVRRGQSIRVIYTSGNWLDIDSLEDVVNAGAF
jgi:phosphoenolpyruvate phosphomutase